MIDLELALSLVSEVSYEGRTETVKLEQSLGRALKESILAPIDSPPFNKSAMDGYALSQGDTREKYRIAGTLAAGDPPFPGLEMGTCIKIMTGAPVPPGTGKIIRVEYTKEEEGYMIPLEEEPYQNIIFQGEHLKAGNPLLYPRIIAVQDIGILAAFGIEEVQVSARPRVGIIATGSEIVDPGQPLGPGQIYNSNGLQITAQASQLGADTTYYGIVPDSEIALRDRISEALATQDCLILSGGVSMGDFDLVPKIIKEAGAEIIFHNVAIKPGKPTLFAKSGRCAIFGLPGNPVSVFMIFHILVRPYLYKWMGVELKDTVLSLPWAEDFKRKDAERTEFRPVILRAGTVCSIFYTGSSHLSALAEAQGIAEIPSGKRIMEKGDLVNVRLL